MKRISRRRFVGSAVAAASTEMVVPSHVLGLGGAKPPGERLNLAGVGIGGQGAHDLAQLSSENIVALCDVDAAHAAHVFKKYPKAVVYKDYRQMLEERKDIDGVVVATPDHLHAAIAAMAMRAGNHVYVQKPLTYSVHEARALARIARETKVVTQMGNQGHSGEGTRRIRDWIQAG